MDKVVWSEDITERIGIAELARKYLEGKVVPSPLAEERLRRILSSIEFNDETFERECRALRDSF